MNQFIFVVDIPKDADPPSNASRSWRDFERNADKDQSPSMKKSKTARNVWLFGCENALPDLVWLSSLVETHDLVYKTFLISGEITPLHSKTRRALVQDSESESEE